MILAQEASLVYWDHGREVPACSQLDLRVAENEFLGILGPSGSGKSSLLYLLSGLKTPTNGHVFFNGQSLGEMAEDARSSLRLKSFGFVFQQPYLVGYLTALENVMIATENKGPISTALALLDSLGIGDKSHRLPHELSGGERQRVCVARALLGNPQVVFADEPTAFLDHENGRAVVDLLNRHRGSGALVMVTHDPEMLHAADRVVHLADGTLQEPESSQVDSP